MSKNELYETADGAESAFGSQMDPLNTANQSGFGPTDGAAATGFGTQPVDSIGGNPSAATPLKIEKVKIKKKLSTGKKAGIAVGGLLITFFLLVIVLDPGPPKVNPSPQPPASAATPAARPMTAEAEIEATVMGNAPATAPEVSTPAVSAPAPEAAEVPAGVKAKSTPQVAEQTQGVASVPTHAETGPVEQTVSGGQPPTQPGVQAVNKANNKIATPVVPAGPSTNSSVATKTESSSLSVDGLAVRVATLEKRLARFERVEAVERVQSTKRRATAPKPKAEISESTRQALMQNNRPASQNMPPATEVRSPVVLNGDSVRVLGISTRRGVTTALVDFGGVKHRVSSGEVIPGLGAVDRVAVDAAGNPVVEINGMRFQ